MRRVAVPVAFLALTGLFLAVQGLLTLARLPGRKTVAQTYARLICALLGVRVRTVGAPVPGEPVLLVANHVSWLDIPVIAATAPVIFVAKSEIARWPVVGPVARIQGTVFVDRNRRRQTAATNAEIAARLRTNEAVVLFAEGTSGDGNRVLRFRSALVGAMEEAVDHDLPDRRLYLQPMSICYTRLNGLPLGRQHRPRVAWYGDLEFLPHFRDLLDAGVVDAVVTYGDPIAHVSASDRKQVVQALEATVRRLTSTTLRACPGDIAA